MKRYTIEAYCTLDSTWKPILGAPTTYANRTAAEERLKIEALTGNARRCRLVNCKGKPVLFAG